MMAYAVGVVFAALLEAANIARWRPHCPMRREGISSWPDGLRHTAPSLPPAQLPRTFAGTSMTRHSALLALALLPGSSAIAQGGKFDLEKTKTVLSSVIQKTLAENGVPSMSIALVRGDSVVWTAAFGYANLRTRTPATTVSNTSALR